MREADLRSWDEVGRVREMKGAATANVDVVPLDMNRQWPAGEAMERKPRQSGETNGLCSEDQIGTESGGIWDVDLALLCRGSVVGNAIATWHRPWERDRAMASPPKLSQTLTSHQLGADASLSQLPIKHPHQLSRLSSACLIPLRHSLTHPSFLRSLHAHLLANCPTFPLTVRTGHQYLWTYIKLTLCFPYL